MSYQNAHINCNNILYTDEAVQLNFSYTNDTLSILLT